MDHLGRKLLFVFTMVLGGVFTLFCAFVEEGGLRTSLALVGKFGASAAGSVIFSHTTELYPSEIRGTAMGICALFGRIGGIAAPQVLPGGCQPA